MSLRLYIDFGSTFTKVLAIDLAGETVVARVQASSTVDTDVTLGLEAALAALRQQLPPGEVDQAPAWACSSAAGGLRMVTVGLVPSLTLEAATRAALGAGAKVVGTFCFKLNRDEVRRIEELRPDIVLLSGGTNGGDSEVPLHNGRCLAESSLACPVIVACNKVVQPEVVAALTRQGKPATAIDNVMPELNRLDIDSCRSEIRRVFMDHIVEAKGIGKAKSLIQNILMPTPAAVLRAAQLLADGYGQEAGLGELLVIDVGGATTDVHSVATGAPTRPRVMFKGLPEPYAKRTVEGDLGVRYNAPHILKLAGRERVLRNLEPFVDGPEQRDQVVGMDIAAVADNLTTHVGYLPSSPGEVLLDLALARTAIEMAVDRHVGSIEVFPSLGGDVLVQRGKDLTALRLVIGTGGPLVFSYRTRSQLGLLSCTTYREDASLLLKPQAPDFRIDSRYLLYAAGLMAEESPLAALHLMKSYLTEPAT